MAESASLVIDREALRAVADQAAALARDEPDMQISENVLDAMAGFQQALARESLFRMEQGARTLLVLDESLNALQQVAEIRARPAAQVVAMVQAIEELLRNVQQVGETTAKLRSSSPDVRVRQMADVVNTAVEQLFRSLEVERWRALECGAEGDIEAGRLRKFGNARAALAHLDRLQSRK